MKILHLEGGANLYGGAQQELYLLEGLSRRHVDNLLACRAGWWRQSVCPTRGLGWPGGQ